MDDDSLDSISIEDPLLTLSDHESRSSMYREDSTTQTTLSEDTPLLSPSQYRYENCSLKTYFAVGGLLTVLVFGVIIGAYLLVVQHNADNILPPNELMYFRYVNRSQWDQNADLDVIQPESFRAKCVVVEQTDTRECFELPSCIRLLNEIQLMLNTTDPMPYNFLIASDGSVYEGLGWSKLSPMYQQCPAIGIVFIGNYKQIPPTSEQTAASKHIMAMAVYKDMLDVYFTLIGKSKKVVPRLLFEKFKSYAKFVQE